MTNQYIQSIINTRQQQRRNSSAQSSNANVPNYASLKQYNAIPGKPKGYLVKENIFQSVGSSAKGVVNNGVYFVNALKGEGTDYSVGRINDLGKLAGGLGIAAALASTAKNPKAKAMEFVGFSTWFSMMSLWPHIVGAPVKAKTGVDINQEYVDSYGRRKKFFEDSQYLTWDLYSDKELNKMGNKLGVPRNIEDRNSAIQDKAKQVSIQANTLMMMTAGIATPITTALICNVLEKPVSNAIESYQRRKAEHGLKNMFSGDALPGHEKGLKDLRDIIGAEDTVSLDAEAKKELYGFFDERFKGTGIGSGVRKELNEQLKVKPSSLEGEAGERVKEAFRTSIMPSDEVLDSIKGITTSERKAVRRAMEVSAKDFDRMLGGRKTLGSASDIEHSLTAHISARLEKAGVDRTLHSTIIDAAKKGLDEEAVRQKTYTAPTQIIEDIFTVAHNFAGRKRIIGNYAKATIANVADSKTANHWDIYPREIIDALGINGKTAQRIIDNPGDASKLIQEHLEELVKPKNKEKLDAAVRKIAKAIKKVTESEAKDQKTLAKLWRQTVAESGREINPEKFKHLSYAVGQASGLARTATENKIMDTKSSFYRVLLVLDRFSDPKTSTHAKRELVSGMGIDFFSNKGEHRGVKNARDWKKLTDQIFHPLTHVLQGDEHSELREAVNMYNAQIKAPLGSIDGGLRNSMSQIGAFKERNKQLKTEKEDLIRKTFEERLSKLQKSKAPKTEAQQALLDDVAASERKLKELEAQKIRMEEFKQRAVKKFEQEQSAVKKKLHAKAVKRIQKSIDSIKINEVKGKRSNMAFDDKYSSVLLPEAKYQIIIKHEISVHDANVGTVGDQRNGYVKKLREKLIQVVSGEPPEHGKAIFAKAKSQVDLMKKAEEDKKQIEKQLKKISDETLKKELVKKKAKAEAIIDQIKNQELPKMVLDKKYNSVLLSDEESQKMLRSIARYDKALGKIARIVNPIRGDWALRTGKSFRNFVNDAITSQKIKNKWLTRTAIIAGALTGVSLLATSMFGKKNDYNHDVYEYKRK